VSYSRLLFLAGILDLLFDRLAFPASGHGIRPGSRWMDLPGVISKMSGC
jgi:hypothetical protein